MVLDVLISCNMSTFLYRTNLKDSDLVLLGLEDPEAFAPFSLKFKFGQGKLKKHCHLVCVKNVGFG